MSLMMADMAEIATSHRRGATNRFSIGTNTSLMTADVAEIATSHRRKATNRFSIGTNMSLMTADMAKIGTSQTGSHKQVLDQYRYQFR